MKPFKRSSCRKSVFGSHAEGVARPDSDLDLALLVKTKPEFPVDYRAEVAGDLAGLLRRQVDVILLNGAPLLLQFEVVRNGVLVLDRDEDERVLYEARVRGRFYDYKRYFDFHAGKLRRSIKERGL